jgi:LytS/YehU family sensor histidine kinase
MLITALAVWIIVMRYKHAVARQREKEKVSLRLTELETKAIRSQMNPHFIFNSLNTLQRFILEDDKRNAYTYLIEFSTLLRKLLESSELDMITLQEEITILDHYIKIEKLRFDNLFEYEIISDIKEMNDVYIPFMMLQPFVENAIWHGLLNKENNRFLKIAFSEPDIHRICCVIEDNGVGRNAGSKEKDPIKKKSLAIDLIRQRLELLERSNGIKCSFEITDLLDKDEKSLGTRVTITIPKLK